ncbi:MAG: bifunctional 4-hydroxy-2-oxoglutarate aldolase/2-dehydro-3-deoxy-phosphogluconate aldolase [Rhodospirillales bacterium]|jgi:2-dehydro-3-deoxyphosphogluconate aldolase/(4S)-4-hydroxy-2-oxoglutarate aldolase|nr:bifunctional 4-hydroxy-2-oxoglutarate aldolase/2-dehydro-3-deoxy-phosphogluconate aldolase [Rhodospirillales bacterium]
MDDIRDILNANRVVPVVVLDRIEDTTPLCEALLQGGIQAIEVTLRSEAAMAAIGEAARRFPDMIVGAGTLLDADHVTQVMDLGAQFGVSPGSTPALLDAVSTKGLPFLPGGSSVSEFMALAEARFAVQKFFPAGPAGGPAFLKSVASPLANISFCPTGGVNADNAADYLALPNVIAVGGSWFVSADRIRNGAWAEITNDAKDIVTRFGRAEA